MTAEDKGKSSRPDKRTRILDATEQIMLEEGYAGVSSRKVATRAGLKSKLLHYYFATMDELFIAAFERRENQYTANLAKAVSSASPLHDMWSLCVDAASSKLNLEFNALACHRPKFRAVIAQSNRRDRITVASALESIFLQYGIDTTKYPPKTVATALAGMARVFATDRALGTEEGHPETLEFIDHLLDSLERLPSGKQAVTAELRR